MISKTITYHSKAHHHPTNNRDIWWYNLPPEGGKLQQGDKIKFILNDCKDGIASVFTVVYEGVWRDRIKSATKNPSNGYTHVKIWRYCDNTTYKVYFGRAIDGEYSINEEN